MYMGHRGMVESATRIKRQIKDMLLAVLEEHRNYGLVVTGHSLGAGVAAILSFKQFVVTNCSKERPGSIVNETLKNRILVLKDISKELDFTLILNI